MVNQENQYSPKQIFRFMELYGLLSRRVNESSTLLGKIKYGSSQKITFSDIGIAHSNLWAAHERYVSGVPEEIRNAKDNWDYLNEAECNLASLKEIYDSRPKSETNRTKRLCIRSNDSQEGQNTSDPTVPIDIRAGKVKLAHHD